MSGVPYTQTKLRTDRPSRQAGNSHTRPHRPTTSHAFLEFRQAHLSIWQRLCTSTVADLRLLTLNITPVGPLHIVWLGAQYLVQQLWVRALLLLLWGLFLRLAALLLQLFLCIEESIVTCTNTATANAQRQYHEAGEPE